MKKEISRDRVEGFLHTSGTSIVNGREEPILLVGWGLGNWMLCEGYMWNMGGCSQFDRPRRIEQTIEALTGKAYAKRFWKTFRESYIADGDLQMMAEMGYNSLRVPIAARLFLEDGPKLRFREEGFRLLDQLLDACEKYRLYVFIDMHAAPGGQTGDNIDDSLDDLCRLFIDDAQFERGLALWEEIARRYHDRWIVGGYDLLNEPIRPPRFEGDTDLDRYTPRLREFYEQAIQRIRLHDQRHMVALEGIHWATDTGIFDHVYDPNMVIHFHRYACPPDISSFERYLEVSRRLQLPLWLGETGENELAWLSALIPLAFRLGISVTLWPWKKMSCVNSPCSVRVPDQWQLIRDYLSGGSQPDFSAAQDIFNQYLHNILIENCELNEQINAQLYRIPGCEISGTETGGQVRKTIKLTVPDGESLRIEYQYNLASNSYNDQTVELSNSASLEGGITQVDEEESNISVTIHKSAAGMDLKGIIIEKVDPDNNGIALEGAEFTLYEWKETAQGNWSYEQVGIYYTDTNGKLSLPDLKKNVAYKLVESKAPQGYENDSTPHYFYIASGSGEVAKPDDFSCYLSNESSVWRDSSFLVTRQDGAALASPANASRAYIESYHCKNFL